MESLEDLRKSIDNIDNAIVAMLAERFKVTTRVGHYKASNKLPAKDVAREVSQHKRMNELSEQYGLDPGFASSILDTVIAKVIENHEGIKVQLTSQGSKGAPRRDTVTGAPA